MTHRHVFGPVLSSRLGRSLGLDLLGAKVCTQDCVYCECGTTRRLTLERGPCVPAGEILAELAAWREAGLPAPDCVTLGGSGEPTLNSGLPEVIAGAKALFPGLPVAVLTNSTLLFDPVVRRELSAADIVLPSLDSLVLDEFEALCRPHRMLCLAELSKGLLTFRQEFAGRLYLEVFLARGINDSEANLRLLRRFCAELAPDRVDVVTLTRPGTERSVEPADAETLARFARELDPGRGGRAGPAEGRMVLRAGLDADLARDMLLATLARRPQTAEDLALALALEPGLVHRVVTRLVEDGELVRSESRGRVFYAVPRERG